MVTPAVLPHPVAPVLEKVLQAFAGPPARRGVVPRADKDPVRGEISPGSRTGNILKIS
jgi:hypothetical protein